MRALKALSSDSKVSLPSFPQVAIIPLSLTGQLGPRRFGVVSFAVLVNSSRLGSFWSSSGSRENLGVAGISGLVS